MTETTNKTNNSIRRLTLDGREIILVGTAHVSQASVEMVR